MLSVLLTIHLIACVALVVAVLLQRSEGGALGMGGGGTGGLISGRGAAGVLVKTTMFLAATFFATSILMTRLNHQAHSSPSVLEREASQPAAPADPLGAGTPALTPSTPAAPAPAPAAPSSTDPLAPVTPAPSSAPPAATTTTAPPASTAPAPSAPSSTPQPSPTAPPT